MDHEDKKRTPAPPTEEDEEIIELIEEVAEESGRLAPEPPASALPDLPALDRNELGEDRKEAAAEDLELLDVEEVPGDEDLLWFEDLDRELLPPDSLSEDRKGEKPEPVAARPPSEPGLETTAVDVFTAYLEAAGEAPEAGQASAAPIPPAVEPAAAALAAVPGALASSARPEAATPALSDAAIEAAVERVLERKLGTDIASAVRQAIEEAVSREIERVKRLILGEDEDAAP
ncbi:MAG: hypothetical protein WHT06_15110 [Desulfobacterales bacterium]